MADATPDRDQTVLRTSVVRKMVKRPIVNRRQRPRDPVELRKQLPALLAQSKRTKSPMTAAPLESEQSPAAEASAAGAATCAQPTEVNNEAAHAACPSDFDPFPDHASAAAESVDRSPRGPDYAALAGVIRGLGKQRERYRSDWREKNDKQSNKGLAMPMIVASKNTVENYLDCGLRLRDQYIRTMARGMSPEDLDPLVFVDWLWAVRPLLDDSTWRFYRQGAERVIQTIPHANLEEALGCLYSDLHTGEDRRPRDEPRATRFDQDHFEKLQLDLGMKRSETARRLQVWLDASIATGVHPSHWPLSSLEIQPDADTPRGKRIWLHVVTGHVQAGWLAHRTLDISTFADSTLKAIEQMIKNAHDWASAGQFSARQGEANRLLRDTSVRLFPRQQRCYDLHSAHYQFVANMKSIYGGAEVAALAGHQLCLHKKREHHVNHRPYWTNISARPVPSARLVKRMKGRLEIYEQLKELKELRDEFRRLRDGDEDQATE
jgi:hypothetical protein